MYTPKFRPKLLECLRGYNLRTLAADVSAGISVGVIALPMAMAFAIGSGVKPEAGLITAIVAGFLTSLLGGSKVAIGGPTGAFVAIVSGIVVSYGVSGLLVCTMMAGAMLFFMGLIRLGQLIRYIPAPLVKGFTTGIAVIILGGQLRDFLGIQGEVDGSNLISALMGLVPRLGETRPFSVLAGSVSLVCIFFWPARLGRYLPGSIVALLAVTLVSVLAAGEGAPLVETIAVRYGGIPGAMPVPRLPEFDLTTFQNLLSPAMTIAMLGAIESLLCATAADGMTGDEHNADQELMAQGIANMAAPFFGALPSTGAIARTAANIRSGARTPVAGLVHSLTLLLITLLLAPLARYIPLAVLSAVLIAVGINMGDWREFINLPRYPRSDAIVFMLTFVLTVVFGLTQAVFVGMFVACLLFIRGISAITQVGIRPASHLEKASAIAAEQRSERDRPYVAEAEAHEDMLLITLSGAMFFGAAKKLKRILSFQRGAYKALIMRMDKVISMDATGLFTLEEIVDTFQGHGVAIILVDMQEQPLKTLKRSGLLDRLGHENIVPDLETALRRAGEIIDGTGQAAPTGENSEGGK
ncbi:MAG: STAS domain-containing protein [Deltaproteobacteria bacterium]|jgi:SulP family sulfate permease|nr:STAS domain-containing protein [Deltaproteobacteria bacterium]